MVHFLPGFDTFFHSIFFFTIVEIPACGQAQWTSAVKNGKDVCLKWQRLCATEKEHKQSVHTVCNSNELKKGNFNYHFVINGNLKKYFIVLKCECRAWSSTQHVKCGLCVCIIINDCIATLLQLCIWFLWNIPHDFFFLSRAERLRANLSSQTSGKLQL